MDRYPRQYGVPVRPVRNSADARFHLAAADGGRRLPAPRQRQAGTGLVAPAGEGAQAGDRMAPRQERGAPRLPCASGLADRCGRAQLRHGPVRLPSRLLATLQGGQGDHADLAYFTVVALASAATAAGDTMRRPALSLTPPVLASALLTVS